MNIIFLPLKGREEKKKINGKTQMSKKCSRAQRLNPVRPPTLLSQCWQLLIGINVHPTPLHDDPSLARAAYNKFSRDSRNDRMPMKVSNNFPVAIVWQIKRHRISNTKRRKKKKKRLQILHLSDDVTKKYLTYNENA